MLNPRFNLVLLNLALCCACAPAGHLATCPANSSILFQEYKAIDVTVAAVVCGSRRLPEALTMLKSVVTASFGVYLKIHIVSDSKALEGGFEEQVNQLHTEFENQGFPFSYKFYTPWFPETDNGGLGDLHWLSGEWAPCMSQRLFFPTILQRVDSIIYLDLDTLVVTDLTEVWSHFTRMSSEQMIGMSRHAELKARHSYYRRTSDLPYYGHTGLDSGVMLMNLTRMRGFEFERRMMEFKEQYNDRLVLPDQDLLNILFHYESDKIYVLPCHSNFNLGHCDPDDPAGFCASAEEEGVAIIHGTGRSFTNEKMPVIRGIYEIMQNFNPSTILLQAHLQNLQTEFGYFKNPCFGLTADTFFAKYQNYIKRN